jgi:hypothetical protein
MGAVANLLARVSGRTRAGGGGSGVDAASASEACWVCYPDREPELRGLMCGAHRARVRDVAYAQGRLNSGTRAYS